MYYGRGIQAKFYLIHTVTPSSVLELAAASKAISTSKVPLPTPLQTHTKHVCVNGGKMAQDVGMV